MKLIKSISSVRKRIKLAKQQGKKIALVPTMGYIHKGHLSLIKKAAKECSFVAVSIFVNPSQFAPNEDYKKYPRDIKRDMRLLKKEGVDLVFTPFVSSMYPENYKTYVTVEDLSNLLCGISRPAHFKGVATVVLKLSNILRPDIAYFGQKDAQQAIIIKKMAKDLNMDIKIKTLPIAREKNGLALSSRNLYLNRKERENAVVIYKSLRKAKELIKSGAQSAGTVISSMRKIIKSANTAKIDYISIVDTENLKPLKRLKGEILIALAVYFGRTRLIDNIIIRRKK